MKFLPRQIFHTPILLGITLLFALFVCVPQPVLAQFYYEDAYYMLEEGYCAYESNVQDAFAAENPTASSPSQIKGRHNAWGDGYTEDELHPSDPLPLGDHTILFILAVITAMTIFYKQRKRKQPSSSVQTLLTTLVFIFVTSPLFALTDGDLRLQYIEQELKKDGKKTIINRLYHFESHPFTLEEGKCDTISVHIFNMIKGGKDHVNHPEIVLQKYNGSEWEDIEAHMIFGPLKGDAGMGLLPGRKNAGETTDSEVDNWVIQDGIEKIKNDQKYEEKGYRASGVWNFVVTKQDGNATFDMNQAHRHEGNFYVRVNGDPNYLNVTNLVTFSEYAYKHIYEDPIGALKPHDYTHYACKYLQAISNVKFTIATEHSPCIAPDYAVEYQRYATDTKVIDKYVNSNATLPATASVRFSWDIMTNRLTRAYIAESKPKLGNEYLVIDGASLASTEANYPYFYDNTDWVYSIDVDYKLDAKAQVKAKYNGKYQYFWGNESIGHAFVHSDGSDDTSLTYPVRIVYDFKEHRFSTIYKPTDVISGTIDLAIPVMILREHNDPATQIVFNSNADKVTAEGDGKYAYSYPAYGVLTFLEDKFATNVSGISHYEKMFYWVSFPFNVKIQDIFGLGEYENYWIIQYYDGAKRALNGLPDGTTAWDYMPADGTLEANVGYIVCLDYKKLSTDYGYTSGEGRKVSLYFPSANRVNTADIHHKGNHTVNLEEYTKGDKVAWNHWNWHLLGVPSFANTTQTNIPFYYQYDHAYDGYGPAACTSTSFFSPMHAYMVQYAGDVNWTGIVNITPKSIAARQTEEDPITLRLELIHGDRTHDKTFIQLRDDKGTKGFDLNLDLTKIINKGANIYTVVNGDQMAGNVVPADEVVIPLGVVITEAGEYTLTLPSNTNGVTVELVDYETGTSTNLLASDYTIRLTAGTHEGRFALHIQPNKVTTGVDCGEVEVANGKTQKLIIDGALYLVKDGVIYDAQGKLVR